MEVARVAMTDAAAAVLRQLVAQHGPLLFHQSGGCCDGSSPMCFPRGEFRVGQRDVLLGELEGTPFYIGGQQFEAWQHTQLLIDVVPGCGAGFSLEAPLGVQVPHPLAGVRPGRAGVAGRLSAGAGRTAQSLDEMGIGNTKKTARTPRKGVTGRLRTGYPESEN